MFSCAPLVLVSFIPAPIPVKVCKHSCVRLVEFFLKKSRDSVPFCPKSTRPKQRPAHTASMTWSWNTIIPNSHSCDRKIPPELPVSKLPKKGWIHINMRFPSINPSIAINCPVNPNICDSFSSTEMSKKLSFILISMQFKSYTEWRLFSVSFHFFFHLSSHNNSWYWEKDLFHPWKSFINL